MIEFELDGKNIKVKPGSTILEVALDEGKYIPHFCYHKKLTIAANCRMCLVEVEKSPKPLPACATPITEGMKVHTCSKLATDAQKGVMEFLLINHPLDCPVCDQGGECQLQELAIGYGRSESRYDEAKRAVTNKDLGPLVTTEMTRCIHCTRCIRFTSEIAGYQELGLSYRNNHVEIMPFINQTVESELSGNIIDICPVGALLSKPFKHQARTWELARRKSIASHDGLGSNIEMHVDKYHRVVRVLPIENENVNECWISDRDRFSYEGLYHEERAVAPMIKQDGKWLTVDWETAISYAAKSINNIKAEYGADSIGVLSSGNSTVEELYLLQKLMREQEIYNLDYRLNQLDFSLNEEGICYLGDNVKNIVDAKSIFIIGSLIREEQPLFAAKIRTAVKNGTKLNVLNVIEEDLLCDINNQITVDPREIAYFLAQLVKISGRWEDLNLDEVEVSSEANKLYQSLESSYIIIGEIAKILPNYAQIVALSNILAKNIAGKIGILAYKANDIGAALAGFLPHKGPFNQLLDKQGKNAKELIDNSQKGYILLNTELELDAYNHRNTLQSLKEAKSVIVISSYINSNIQEYADIVLPIATFTETAGTFVNMEGLWQKFNPVTRPFKDAKPAWKVIRVLANYLGSKNFEYTDINQIREEIKSLERFVLSNDIKIESFAIAKPVLSDITNVVLQSIYNVDSITRRAASLQRTILANLPKVTINKNLAVKNNIIDKNIVVNDSIVNTVAIFRDNISLDFKII